jgi:hypothetical protein
MVVRTRLTLGTRDTPRFVSEAFYDAMQSLCQAWQYDVSFYPTTIMYQIPGHMVVERTPGIHLQPPIDRYDVSLDDTSGIPRCKRTAILGKNTFRRKIPGNGFDRIEWTTEGCTFSYFLLTPDAMFIGAEIFTDWYKYHIIHRNVIWYVHFRKVYVDPYDVANTIWFYGSPKFQVELITEEDFRDRPRELKAALSAILPRAFRWESPM